MEKNLQQARKSPIRSHLIDFHIGNRVASNITETNTVNSVLLSINNNRINDNRQQNGGNLEARIIFLTTVFNRFNYRTKSKAQITQNFE